MATQMFEGAKRTGYVNETVTQKNTEAIIGIGWPNDEKVTKNRLSRNALPTVYRGAFAAALLRL